MTDYRLVMSLLIQNLSYRQIEALAGCSHTTIAKASKICQDQGFTSTTQVEYLTAEELDALGIARRSCPSTQLGQHTREKHTNFPIARKHEAWYIRIRPRIHHHPGALVPAVPSSIIDPLWCQFAALIPPVIDTHPLGCHRPRIADRIVFDKLIHVLVLGASYAKIADTTCSATTLRTRRDEWITAGIFEQLEQLCLESYDRIVGLALENLSVDGCIVKAPCGGEAAGRSRVDRGKQGTKRSLLVDGHGIPLGCVVAGANRNDSPLLRPTLDKLDRFGCHLPEMITVHLDAGYDSKKTRRLLTELGCDWVISAKGEPLQVGARWVVERTNSWHNRGFKKLLICTERRARVLEAFIALANAVIVVRRLVREAWSTYRWDTRPARRP